jgi:hypothetical protein
MICIACRFWKYEGVPFCVLRFAFGVLSIFEREFSGLPPAPGVSSVGPILGQGGFVGPILDQKAANDFSWPSWCWACHFRTERLFFEGRQLFGFFSQMIGPVNNRINKLCCFSSRLSPFSLGKVLVLQKIVRPFCGRFRSRHFSDSAGGPSVLVLYCKILKNL